MNRQNIGQICSKVQHATLEMLHVIEVRAMVFNTTFNNTSVISWWLAILLEETGKPGENPQPTASNGQTSSHHVVSSTLLHECFM
jgi:hypothetical protein